MFRRILGIKEFDYNSAIQNCNLVNTQAQRVFDNLNLVKNQYLEAEAANLNRDAQQIINRLAERKNLTNDQQQQAKFPHEVRESFNYKVVANLPYYITSPVLRHFLEASAKPQTMIVMVQKEVAEEIVAKPGRMSLLSVSVQLYGEPTIIGYVPARCFYPAPEVDSAILKITLYPQPVVEVADKESFFNLVRAGFSASRKQIANSLALGLGLPKAEVMPLLETAGIICQRRAETLALEEWQRLWQVLRERQKW